MIKLIVAMDQNNLIGNDNKMPWHIKSEFEHFKKSTMGHSLVFGRTTYQGLPQKLSGRDIYVFSSQQLEDVSNINNKKSLLALFDKFKNSKETLFIAGGKKLYEEFYKYADELIISIVKGKYEGNVYLELNLKKYKISQIKEYKEFKVITYFK